MGDAVNNKDNKKKVSKEKIKSPEKVDHPRLSDKEFRLRQGLPPDLPRRPTDFYITPELRDQQCRRINTLLEQGRKVWIHGLGSSIPLVITIINTLRENFGTDKIVENSYSHSWEGLTETWEQVETGVISGLHISVTKLQEQSAIDKP